MKKNGFSCLYNYFQILNWNKIGWSGSKEPEGKIFKGGKTPRIGRYVWQHKATKNRGVMELWQPQDKFQNPFVVVKNVLGLLK